jgi:TPR repeat protein
MPRWIAVAAAALACGLALPARADDAADCAGGAVAACQRQADHGDPIAQKLLGSMYADGQGVARDYVRAYLWLSLAASGTSDVVTPHAIAARNKVAVLMSPAQIAKAKALAAAWKPTW